MPEAEKTIEDEMDELDAVLDAEKEIINNEEDSSETETEEASEDKTEEKKSEEAQSTEDVTEEEEKSDDVTDEKEEVEISSDDRIKELLTKIDELQGKVIVPEVKTEETKEELVDFLKDIDLDGLHSDPEIMNQVFQSIISHTLKQANKNLDSRIPGMIKSQVSDSQNSRSLADQFYKDNSDLVNVRNVVRACAEQLKQEKPDYTIKQILDEAAVRTRTTLGIKPLMKSNVPDSDKTGLVNHTKSGRNKKQKISALQQELDEL